MRIGIMASIGEGNLGDEMILDAHVQELFAVFGFHDDFQLDIYTANVTETRDRFASYGDKIVVFPSVPVGFRSFLRSIFSGSLFRTLSALIACNHVLIGGGGILYSQETNIGINPLLVWYLRIFLVRLCGVKVHLSSVGVEHIGYGFDRMLLRGICRMCNSLNVRDDGSRAKLVDSGVKSSISVMHDIVFDLDWVTCEPSSNMRHSVGLVLREWGKLSGEQGAVFWRKVAYSLRDELGMRVVFLPFSYSEPDDRAFVQRILASEASHGFEVWNGPYSVTSLQDMISELDVVLSIRYHGMISALKSGRRLVGLGYGNKTECLSQQFCFEFSSLEGVSTTSIVAMVRASVAVKMNPLEMKYRDYFMSVLR